MTPILLFDPRREHSFVPITKSCHRRDAGTVKAGRIFAATRGGLALIGPSTAACLPAWAKGAARWPISNRWFSSIFTPLLTSRNQTAEAYCGLKRRAGRKKVCPARGTGRCSVACSCSESTARGDWRPRSDNECRNGKPYCLEGMPRNVCPERQAFVQTAYRASRR